MAMHTDSKVIRDELVEAILSHYEGSDHKCEVEPVRRNAFCVRVDDGPIFTIDVSHGGALIGVDKRTSRAEEVGSRSTYRDEVRATLRGMSDEAVAYQQARGSPGGIDREEIELEANLRRDPERLALVEEVGRFCPHGIDLWHSGCYSCLKARGAVWTCSPEAEAAFHGQPNPYLEGGVGR